MKVKALKNLIYNGTFHLSGDVFIMKDADVTGYENRHWVIRLLQDKKPAVKTNAQPGLPPLEVEPRGKKK